MKQLNRIKNYLTINPIGYLIPTFLVGLVFSIIVLSLPLHDFANNYFPALLATESIPPETVLYDIYDFNQYAWSKGYESVLADFYLNSPFTSTLFYPFALIKNAYYSKLIFNLISILFFTWALQLFNKKYLDKNNRFLLLTVPVLFFIPIRNNIEFGQVYLIIISFILIGYSYLDANKKGTGELLLSLSILTKIFPIFYCIPLIYKRKWKSIITVLISTLILLFISVLVGGISFWKTYLLEIMPNAFLNESTVNFQSNAQSFTVFVKTLFVPDSYYNTDAVFNSPTLYKIITWLFSSFILSIAISASLNARKQTLRLLSIWIITLFLIQSRTATYAQILWLIPAFEIFRGEFSKATKVGVFLLLLLVCNFPFHWLIDLPILIKFSRMWLSILLGIICLYSFNAKLNLQFLKVFLVLFLPFLLLTISKKQQTEDSDYVLDKKEYFLIHDFYIQDNFLVYEALGKNGNEIVKTQIPIERFDTTVCQIIEGQIFYKNKKITKSHSLKKNAVLINDKEIYYLTDQHSRRGAYTIKKIPVSL